MYMVMGAFCGGSGYRLLLPYILYCQLTFLPQRDVTLVVCNICPLQMVMFEQYFFKFRDGNAFLKDHVKVAISLIA